MKLTDTDLSELTDVAIGAAAAAAEMIAQSRPSEVQHKAGGASPASQVVTDIDRRSEALIVERLTPTLRRFELALLTEEREDDGGRLTADHFWCVDPLDGTLPFVEGAPGYSVSIALVARDGTPLIGVISDPVETTLFHAIAGGGAFRDGRPLPTDLSPDASVLSVFADRSFRSNEDHDAVVTGLEDIARDMGLGGVRIDTTGGAVMNACRVLANAPACYFKFPKPAGGGSVWDFAATVCLFGAVDAVATDIDGDPLDLNRPDSTFMHHRGVLFATDESLAQRIRDLHLSLA